MTDQPQQTNPDEHRYYPEDEIELMDYLLVLWKWKYLIIAGTLAFAIVAGLISFTTWKQQPNMYRTNIVLKPGILKIDEGGKPVFVDSPENIKALIEGNLKYNVLDYIKSSNVPNLSHSAEFKVDIPQGSGIINVSLESSEADQDKTKLNYLIKTLLAEFDNKTKYIQKGIDEKIKLKEETQANLKNMEIKIKLKYEKALKLKKDDLVDLELEEQRLKKDTNDIPARLAELQQKVKFLNDSNELLIKQRNNLIKNSDQNVTLPAILSSNTIQQNLAIEDSYYKQIQRCYLSKRDAESNLIKVQQKIAFALKENKELEKRKNDIQAISIFQPDLYENQKLIEKVTKEIEELEKEKMNIQNIQVAQPPFTTELPKTKSKIKRNVVLSSVMGLFLMIFLSFFLEYLSNYKSKRKASN